MKRLWAFAAALVVGLTWVSLAVAQDPVQRGYGGVAGNVQGEVQGGGGGSLPFTGLDLLLLVAAGALLLGAGLVLRRVGRARS
ncbi:MAG TPA: hypothetical protein VE644_10950 [Gaiellaceae bacterium]|nr:hypothetical protein [Gaiellaceae bacterium]